MYMELWPLQLLTILTLVLMVSILWTYYRGGPWAPTRLGKVQKMLSMAGTSPDDVVYDLGCGDGRFIVTAARQYGARAVGIELDPLRFLWCQLLITILGLRNRVKVLYGDFFARDLSGADVVVCYLLQGTNEKLQAKFRQELKPETRIVSNTFTFPGLQLLRQDDSARLYLYRPLPRPAQSKT